MNMLPLLCFVSIAAAELVRWDSTISPSEIPGHEIKVHMVAPQRGNDSEKLPLVLLMHGDPCEWWWYEYAANYLVPNNYVVGLMASYEPVGLPEKMAQDMRFALDFLYNESTAVSSSPLYHRLSFRAAAAGHSAGSIAALMSMGQPNHGFRHTFDAIYAMAPMSTPELLVALDRRESEPLVFMMSGSSDCVCPAKHAEPIYRHLPSSFCKYFSILRNGTHCHFADIHSLDHVCYEVEQGSCPHDTNRPQVPRDVQLDLSKHYMLLFFNAALKLPRGSPEQKQRLGALHSILAAEQLSGYMTSVNYTCSLEARDLPYSS